MRASLEQGYTVPPAPQSLNRSAFLPRKTRLPGCATAASTPNISLHPESPILGREA